MVCEQHGEALKLFCETDQVLMCLICRESRGHRAHPAAPILALLRSLLQQIQTQLQLLRGERKRLETLRGSESQKHQEYQQKAAAERQKIVAVFERLRRFLEEQERFVLAEVERGIEKRHEEHAEQKKFQETLLCDLEKGKGGPQGSYTRAMATESSVQSLQDEVTCSVCLEFFRDPVMIMGCGHNFCQACIAQCWEGAETDVTCPQCRQTFAQRLLGPNRQLANVVELVKGLSMRGAGGKTVCEQHREALNLFCETDQVLMCVICWESRAHQAHPAAPIQEAAQQCKEQIQTQLQLLRREREGLEALRGSESQKHQEYQLPR
ncbi:hypothetical protein Y1Q_0006856 [Alligator mississippiensis]|uniref:Zinc finger protein RFP-like n=1 Tax=Alligator mississippiensis TaxID=8496 RepID=A0A151M5X6_ALLMI|nr:hypothetical protein Y1Q_0006856 [Alligator mississippiensis]